MAGVGFQLAGSRDGGVGGIAGAALHGAVISAGPWIITAAAMVLLDHWTVAWLDHAGLALVQTTLIYAFSVSAILAAPVGVLAMRLVADRLFAKDAAGSRAS
ncbi:exopolysaccharide Pel transporter PelG [Sphingomonas sp. MMS24-JH45]